MADDALPVLCGRCQVEIEEAEEPDSAERASCPSCGLTETFENIDREVSQFLEDQLTDDGASETNHQLQPNADVSPDDELHRSYRFVVDLDDLRSEVLSHAEEPAIEEAFKTESSASGRG